MHMRSQACEHWFLAMKHAHAVMHALDTRRIVISRCCCAVWQTAGCSCPFSMCSKIQDQRFRHVHCPDCGLDRSETVVCGDCGSGATAYTTYFGSCGLAGRCGQWCCGRVYRVYFEMRSSHKLQGSNCVQLPLQAIWYACCVVIRIHSV